jgi:hypothetical protein
MGFGARGAAFSPAADGEQRAGSPAARWPGEEIIPAPSGNSSVGVNSGIQALSRAAGPDALW